MVIVNSALFAIVHIVCIVAVHRVCADNDLFTCVHVIFKTILLLTLFITSTPNGRPHCLCEKHDSLVRLPCHLPPQCRPVKRLPLVALYRVPDGIMG